MDIRNEQTAAAPPSPAGLRGGWFALREWSGAFGDLGTLMLTGFT